MGILSAGKELISNEKVEELSLDLLSDCMAMLNGDVLAAARVLCSVAKSGLGIRDKIFWGKFKRFIEGVEVSPDYLGDLCRILAENDKNGDVIMRLLDTIDKIDTMNKAEYLANAGRCVATGFIDRESFFRICHVLKNCLQEDLLFLQKSILDNEEYEYSNTVQGLWNCGLMYQCVVDSGGNDRYAFTPFAYVLDRYALSYNNVDRYPMCGRQEEQLPNKINVRPVMRLGQE